MRRSACDCERTNQRRKSGTKFIRRHSRLSRQGRALSLFDHSSSGRDYDSKFRQKMEMKVMQNRNAKSPCLYAVEAPHLICRNWRRDEPRHESSFNSRSWKGATMDGTWKGGKKRRAKAFPLPRQIGRGKRSCHTKRGEEREKKEGGELKGIWEERGSEGEPGPRARLSSPVHRNATTCR